MTTTSKTLMNLFLDYIPSTPSCHELIIIDLESKGLLLLKIHAVNQ